MGCGSNADDHQANVLGGKSPEQSRPVRYDIHDVECNRRRAVFNARTNERGIKFEYSLRSTHISMLASLSIVTSAMDVR